MKMVLLGGALLIGLALPAQAQMGGGPQGPMKRDDYMALQKQRFTMLDANGDGVVTKDELSAMAAKRMGNPPPPEMIDTVFKRMDTDGDGKATAAEVTAAEMARFDAMDTNHDGILTPEERRAGMAAMRRP